MEIVQDDNTVQTPEITQEVRIANAIEAFNNHNQELEAAEYDVSLTRKDALFIVDDLVDRHEWLGPQALFIEHIDKVFSSKLSDMLKKSENTTTLKIAINTGTMDMIVQMLQKFVGRGVETAKIYKSTQEAFEPAWIAREAGRDTLYTLNAEWRAAEEDITIEQYMAREKKAGEMAQAERDGEQPS